jgi:hypothetical protein
VHPSCYTTTGTKAKETHLISFQASMLNADILVKASLALIDIDCENKSA